MSEMPTSAPNNSIGEKMQPRVQIVGGGIAGLSLACHLRQRQIPFKIFDAASKPKGHNYGITISQGAYQSLLPALEAKPDLPSFTKLTAVDRLVGGHGVVSASDHATTPPTEHRVRVADASLRDVLSQGHTINWNHKVTETQSDPSGLTLRFENGESSTAPITIDAGGERSGLLSSLLPDLAPDVLPYAVYHGSRYFSLPDFESRYRDLFPSSSNVSEHIHAFQPPYPSSPPTTIYIQLSKSHIDPCTLPSPLRSHFSNQETHPLVELRYTISRPALSTSDVQDPTFNPSRSPSEAKTIPADFFAELSALLSQNSDMPASLRDLIAPSAIQANKDRVLNWLLRRKIPSAGNLDALAGKGVLLIGDAAHGLPILGSTGASRAMEDARILAGFLAEQIGREGEAVGDGLSRFYEEREIKKAWERAEVQSRQWLREVHREESVMETDSKL